MNAKLIKSSDYEKILPVDAERNFHFHAFCNLGDVFEPATERHL